MSARTEQSVRIAAKLYEARDAMKFLWRDQYPEKIAHYQKYIHAAMEKHSCDAMRAVIDVVSSLQKKAPNSGMSQALLFAAYVEMVESGDGK